MMPSNRRLKAFSLVVVIVILLTLYISASARQTRSSDFYTKTQDALSTSRQVKEANLAESEVATGEDEMIKQRLKAAEEAAKLKAEKKAEDYHGQEAKQKALQVAESLRGDPDADEKEAKDYIAPKSSKNSKSGTGRKGPENGEKGVAGRVVMKDPKEAVLKTSGNVEKADKDKDEEEDEDAFREETEDELKAHEELAEILKKSPIIIFSKSYCPYSKKAKHILLEKYKITPPPYVVELDLHPLGQPLQNYLGGLTGRKTVPNILIQAKSIGGGDDVQALDQSGKLIDTVLRMGGKRMKISKVLTEAEKAKEKEMKEKREAERRKKRHFWS